MVGDISSINHHESLFPQMALKVFKLKPHRPIYWHHSLTVRCFLKTKQQFLVMSPSDMLSFFRGLLFKKKTCHLCLIISDQYR